MAAVVMVLVLASGPKPALAKTLTCDQKVVPHSATLVQRTRQKALADPSCAKLIRDTDRVLLQAEASTRSAQQVAKQDLDALTQDWAVKKQALPRGGDGAPLIRSKTGVIYSLETEAPVLEGVPQSVPWSSLASWEDYQTVKAEYQRLTARIRELVTYRCDTLIPSRNQLVPYAKLNLPD